MSKGYKVRGMFKVADYELTGVRFEIQESTRSQLIAVIHRIRGVIDMQGGEFQEHAIRTEVPITPKIERRLVANSRLLYGAMGLSTEAGRAWEAVTKHVMYGQPLDRADVINKIGEILFACSVIADAIGTDLDAVMKAEIDKLRHKFPDAFTDAILSKDGISEDAKEDEKEESENTVKPFEPDVFDDESKDDPFEMDEFKIDEEDTDDFEEDEDDFLEDDEDEEEEENDGESSGDTREINEQRQGASEETDTKVSKPGEIIRLIGPPTLGVQDRRLCAGQNHPSGSLVPVLS